MLTFSAVLSSEENPTPNIKAACNVSARNKLKLKRSFAVMVALANLIHQVKLIRLVRLAQFRQYGIDQGTGDIKGKLCVEFSNASRARDVDFSQIIADHIYTHKDETTAF